MNPGISDSLAWLASRNGNFSVNSAYGAIAHYHSIPTDPLFRLIWKWKGLERIKVFLWQVVLDALPTNFLRFSKHISYNPYCSWSDSNMHETILHLLHDYDFAQFLE